MATATTAKKEFDRDRFYKLVLLMDSSDEFETSASAQALQICMAAGIRFFDAAAEACGKDNERVAALETQLDDARRGGDELADELQRCQATLAEYRKAERTRNRVCRRCEMNCRGIAFMLGGVILAGWFYEYPPEQVAHRRTPLS